MKKHILTLLTVLVAMGVRAQSSDPVFSSGHLKNGLTYYIRHTKFEPRKADFYLVQNVGALQEEDNQNGLAHVLEHMAFNATKHFPLGVPEFLRRHQISTFNAHTGQNETVYHINGFPTADPRLVDSAILVLNDWSGFLELRPDQIEKERGIILEERRMTTDTRALLEQDANRYIYNFSKYAVHNVIGSEQILKTFTAQQLKDYYHDFYRPDQQAVIIIGDIDVSQVEQRVKELFGAIAPRVNPKPRLEYGIEDNAEPNYVKTFDKNVPGHAMALMKRFKVEKPTTIEQLVRDNLISYFYGNIINKYLKLDTDGDQNYLQVGLSVRSLVRGYKSADLFIRSVPGKELVSAEQFMVRWKRMNTYAINQKELDAQRTNYLMNLGATEKYKDRLQNSVYVEIYKNNFLLRNPITSVDEDIATSRKVLETLRVEDIKQWVDSWFTTPQNWTFVMQGNDPNYRFPSAQELSEAIRKAMATEVAPYEKARPTAPLFDLTPKAGTIVKSRALRSMQAEEWTLSNGARVLYRYATSERGNIIVNAVSPGGRSLLEARDLPTADVLNDMAFNGGIYKHDRRMIERIMQRLNVKFSVSLNSNTESLGGSASRQNAEQLFQLIYLAFEHPRFDRSEYDKYVYMNRLNSESTPSTLQDSIMKVTRNLLADSPERQWDKDSAYYNSLSFDRMVEIYGERFRSASDFTFIIVGDIDREKAVYMVENYLASIKSDSSHETARHYSLYKRGDLTYDLVAPIPDRKYIVELKYENNLKLTPREEISMYVLQKVLKDNLMADIREKQKGSYNIDTQADVVGYPENSQTLSIRFESSLEQGTKMREIARMALRKIVDEGVDGESVEQVVRGLKQRREEMLQSNSFWAGVLYGYSIDGHNEASAAMFEKVADKLTAREVQRFAAKYLQSAKLKDLVIRSRD